MISSYWPWWLLHILSIGWVHVPDQLLLCIGSEVCTDSPFCNAPGLFECTWPCAVFYQFSCPCQLIRHKFLTSLDWPMTLWLIQLAGYVPPFKIIYVIFQILIWISHIPKYRILRKSQSVFIIRGHMQAPIY